MMYELSQKVIERKIIELKNEIELLKQEKNPSFITKLKLRGKEHELKMLQDGIEIDHNNEECEFCSS